MKFRKYFITVLITFFILVSSAFAVIQIQFRRALAADWTSDDPTLAEGELGYETDTTKVKIGDGSTAWTGLAYVTNIGAEVNNLETAITDIASGEIFVGDGADSGTYNALTTYVGQDVKNLRVIHVNDEDIDIDAEILQVGLFSLTSVDLTVLTDAANGANALDTGSMANTTWYYSWVIAKADGTVAGLASASSTAPTMPADYIYKRRVGSFRTDGSADIIAFHTDGNGWHWYEDEYAVSEGGTATSFTAIDISSLMPPTSTFWHGNGASNDTANTAILEMRATGDTDGVIRIHQGVTGATAIIIYVAFLCPTNTSQSFDYKIQADDSGAWIYLNAYLDNL